MRRFTGAVLAAFLLALPAPALAGIEELVLTIKGMSCAF